MSGKTLTDLRELLTQALEKAPSVPAEPRLSQSIEATAYWTFAPSLEIVLADAERLPPEGQAVAAWTKRLNKRAIPLVLIVEAGDEHLLVGPSGKPPPALRLDGRLVVDELAAARELDPLDVRKRLPLVWQRVRGAGGMTGLRNVGLFSALSVPRSPLVMRRLSSYRKALNAGDTTQLGAALGVLEVVADEGLRPPEADESQPPALTPERIRLICYQVVHG